MFYYRINITHTITEKILCIFVVCIYFIQKKKKKENLKWKFEKEMN